MEPIVVIGAGLAGCEAAWQIAKRGGKVILYEMKPEVYSSAHRSPFFAELVCSNSFKSESLENASGVLKEEMRKLESLVLRVAKEARVPAGDSLAVDREVFSRQITQILESLDNVEVIRKEISSIPQDRITIIATGPLTSEVLSKEIQKVTGGRHLFFYDAISPIVTADSIDFQRAFKSSRYGKGGEDYVNCPMDEEVYGRFVEALNQAERALVHLFEKRYLFEGCLPVEEMAERGRGTLAFGPLKPVGLVDPKTGKQPFAVVQLRQEDRFETLFNLVGFQTRLKHEEQKKVFRMIPGLEKAEFVRLGSIHRNTFIDSPRLLGESLQLKTLPDLFFAGQVTGVEGYMESTAIGLLSGINAHRYANGMPAIVPPATTAMGALVGYITHSTAVPFQPMNINFGLFPPLPGKSRGRGKRLLLAKRALRDMEEWKNRSEG
ncbi:MAG TPA: methylenetetrahydrofolate--tRNA-(uracil(54)-C(5))-methyltransferase (FADH(2)-oxidizing) TrmFO [Thermodesulfobacteriota bacterium]|jgi:methylenetetrahydrofolate--tRNA-(uracil-5-)-methyltransferase|nr:methylenetetrahydrofolate--tRNA-(uracil(54)-C(5))-methyltransferase (FADH(2)-oxidizing) TrmFO [Thermodesulfobacteriota bacterium]